MVDNITPPTSEQIRNKQMYDIFKNLDPILSHNPVLHEPDPVWSFNSNEEAEGFIAFFKDIWKLGENRIAIANQNVPLVLEGNQVGSKPRVVVKLETNLSYVEGKVDDWAKEKGIPGGKSCVGLRFRI